MQSQTTKINQKNETEYPYNAYQWLDVNYINAIVPSAGAFFKQNDTGEFIGGYLLSNINHTPSIFAGSIWVRGLDENETGHVSAERFNQLGYDYDEGTDSTNGFGSNLPVQTVTVLSSLSPTEPGGYSVSNPLSAAFYFNNFGASPPATTDPTNASEYYSYLQGKWKDGTAIYYGGTGHISDAGTPDVQTDYIFPGSSDPNGIGTDGIQMEPWSEVSENNVPDDRRGLLVAGPYNLSPGEHKSIELVYAHIPANLILASKGSGSIPPFQPALDTVINWYLHERIPSNYAAADSLSSIDAQKPALEISVYPNPATYTLHIQGSETIEDISIYDICGRTVLRKKIPGNRKNIKLDVSDMKSGYYLLSVKSLNKLRIRKVVIE